MDTPVLRELLKNWNPAADATPRIRQSGAIPYSIISGRIVFLLVTSRRAGRWIFPKGSISAGITAWDSAAKEALEEAGVTGDVSALVAGTYQDTDKGVVMDIDLYPLEVTAQLDDWDEKGQRLRHWVVLAETQRLIEDRAVRRIVRQLHRDLKRRQQPPRSGAAAHRPAH